MKLLKLLENIVHERYSGVDIKMFALFSEQNKINITEGRREKIFSFPVKTIYYKEQ